jgi:hypothetical protein
MESRRTTNWLLLAIAVLLSICALRLFGTPVSVAHAATAKPTNQVEIVGCYAASTGIGGCTYKAVPVDFEGRLLVAPK